MDPVRQRSVVLRIGGLVCVFIAAVQFCSAITISSALSDWKSLRDSLNSTVLPQFINMANFTPPEFELTSYTTLLEAGRIYFIAKVHISASEYAHLKIAKPMPNVAATAFTLLAYQRKFVLTDPLADFTHANSDNNNNNNKKPTTKQPSRIDNSPTRTIESTNNFSVFATKEIRDNFTISANYTPHLFRPAASLCHLKNLSCVVKVQLDDHEYVHLHVVRRSINSTAVLVGFKRDLTINDPLEWFENENDTTSEEQWLRTELNGTILDQFKTTFGFKPLRFHLVQYLFTSRNNCKEYVIKVHANDTDYIHLRVSQAANLALSLRGAFFNKSLNDSLEIFKAELPLYMPSRSFKNVSEANVWSIALPVDHVDSEIRLIVEAVKIDFLRRAKVSPIMLVPILYKKLIERECSAYVVQIRTDEHYYAHLKIVRPEIALFQSHASPRLVEFKLNKKLSDALATGSGDESFCHANASISSDISEQLAPLDLPSKETQFAVQSVLLEFIRASSSHLAVIFVAISERRQITNPSIRFVKVQYSRDMYAHLKIISVDGDSLLLSLIAGMKKSDPILYF